MMKIKKKTLLAAMAGWAVLAPALAFNIDFDNVPGDYGLASYKQGPYTLMPTHDYGMATPQSVFSTQPPLSSGYLWIYGGAGDVSGFTLARDAQQSFRLFSFTFGGPFATAVDKLVVTGLLTSGETVQATWSQPQALTPIQYVLDQTDPRWTELVSVDFAAYGLHNRAMFDNIVVMESPVPEPSTLSFMSMGFASLFLASARRARRQTGRQSRD